MKALTDLQRALIAGAVIVLALLGGAWALYRAGESAGQLGERSTWLKAAKATKEAFDLAQAKLEADYKADLETERRRNIAINLKVSQDHEEETATLRRERDADRAAFDRAGGLRIRTSAVCPAAGGAGSGPEAAGAGGRDEASATTVRLPLEVENDLWAIVNDADEVSGQLRACQSWIRMNGFYGQEAADSGQLLDRMIASPNPHTKEAPHGD